ncbi:unnamed protein product, partial [Phaeothamnion confervicola]
MTMRIASLAFSSPYLVLFPSSLNGVVFRRTRRRWRRRRESTSIRRRRRRLRRPSTSRARRTAARWSTSRATLRRTPISRNGAAPATATAAGRAASAGRRDGGARDTGEATMKMRMRMTEGAATAAKRTAA